MLQTLFIETEFGRVHAQAAGSPAHPLVLSLHGWSQRNGWHTWEPLLAPLATADFYAVSVDMPGWGQSESAQQEPLSGERAVAAVAAILEGLAVKRAMLMGKSWGGGLAISLALAQPQRVKSLILTAPACRELDRLPAVTQPVLLAWAEDDPVIPYRYAATFAAALPDCRLITFPTGGHSAAPNNAEVFAPEAIRFLKDNTSQGEMVE